MVDAFHVTLCDVILTLLVSSSRTITSLLLVINYSQQAFASGSLPDDDIRMSTASFVPSINTANNVIMTTKPEVYIIGQGQTLEAMCEFRTDEFHLFDNPVVWKKSQLEEDVQIHIMGNIFKPFLQTGRFEVEFAPEHPHFCFVLRVSNVTIEDSGNYTCEVRGPKSSILATVTHTVYVRASVRQLYLTVEDTQYSATTVPNAADNNEGSSLLASPAAISPSMTSSRVSATDAEAYSAASGQLTFVDGKPRRIGCVAVGGNPFPTVRVYLNNRDITDSMLSSSAVSIVSGPPGLRHIVSNIQLYGGLVTLGSSDDGSKLRCVASVTGLAPNITESTVEVQYGPIIHCEARTADLDEPNVYLCCQVRARPDVTSLFWIVDVNGTAVVDGDATNGYWSMVTDRNDAIETRLYLSRASRGTFRTYTVVAENAVAETTQQVRLELNLKDAFGVFDVNNEGFINHVKLFKGMRAFGYNPTEAEVQDMILAVNNDGSGRISFDEFVATMITKMRNHSTDDDILKRAFDALDVDKNGIVGEDDVRTLLTRLGQEKNIRNDIATVIKASEISSGSTFTYQQFRQFIKESQSQQ